ncbi:rRNA accumulation- protein [Chamberlinius hualienensis]
MAEATKLLFQQAVDCLLNNWPALQLAVQHEAGGSDRVSIGKWLPGALGQYIIDNNGLEVDEIEDFLIDFFDRYMNTFVEDGSILEIANKLANYYQMYRNNHMQKLQTAIQEIPNFDFTVHQESSNSTTGSVLEHCAYDSTERVSDTDKTEPPDQMETEDADGWQTVSKGRTKHKK